MEDYKKAIGFYEDLVVQPDTAPAFRTLISKAYAGLGRCWIAEKNYDEAIKRLGEWTAKARGAESKDSDWLAVKYYLAVALHKKAEGLKDEKEKRKLLRDARVALRDVTRNPNDFEKEAKKLYARLGSGDGDDGAPKTFAEAFDAGREAVTMMQSTQSVLKAAAGNNKKAVPKLEEQLKQSRDDAMRLFELALGLVDGETDINKVNLVRYYLSYLNWERQRYYNAAIFGEFLAEKYPQSGGARAAAKIAMASYLAKYNEPGNKTKDFDARQIVDVAKLIARRWPGKPEADEAYNMLVSFMLQQEKFAEAEQYLQKISPEYPDRGQAELKVGQSYWIQYVRNLRLPDDQRPPQAELDALKKKARATLETGFERMRARGEGGSTAAGAALSLAQIYLDTSQPKLAIKILEDKQLGPLTLLAKNDPSARREGYAEGAYKAALRAYVTVTPPQLEKAEKIMDALEASVADQGKDAAEKLTLIFIDLGRQLEEQLDVLKGEGKTDQIQQVAKSFEVFLDRVGQREKGNTWASRNWVASTYYNLGTGFDGKGALRKQADAYYNKAIAGYQKILSEVEQDPSFAPGEDAVLAVQMRIAQCQRKLGQYREALDLLAEVLGKKPMMLEAQVAAAYAYQERGDAEDPKWYYYARQGGRKDPKTGKDRIWGWGKLAQITARYPQYRAVFHEARYNLTKCRLSEAGKQTAALKKRELLERAKADLRVLMKLYPDMGGPEWTAKYDQLMKDIQRALNEKPEGLAVFKSS
jgi:tetratricopeptide (TPR) repeat protein